jgi:transposase
MIQITPHMRLLVAVEPVDFRRGIDGLARLCREQLQSDPFGGTLFIFRNRRGTAIKCLTYDGQGFWLLYKRFSASRFRFWPVGEKGTHAKTLDAHEVQLLLSGGDPGAASTAPPPWRRIPAVG